MSLRPPSSTPTATIFPYTTLFRSHPSGGRPPPATDPDDLHRHGHRRPAAGHTRRRGRGGAPFHRRGGGVRRQPGDADHAVPDPDPLFARSEEHTSELQSLMRSSYAVFCLKKKNNRTTVNTHV